MRPGPSPGTRPSTYVDDRLIRYPLMTDQWRRHELASDDERYLELTGGSYHWGAEISNEARRILILFDTNGETVPYLPLAQTSDELGNSQSDSLSRIAAINGSYLDDSFNQKSSRIPEPVTGDKPFERWASFCERHELIAYGFSLEGHVFVDASVSLWEPFLDTRVSLWERSSEQGHNKIHAMIQSGDGEDSTEALHGFQNWNRSASEIDEQSSTSGISDLYAAFDLRIEVLLDNNPGLAGLANRLIRHITPKLHLLGPLFKGDGLLSLFEEDAANDGEQGQSSQPTSSCTPANLNGNSVGANQNDGDPTKRPRERRDGDDDGEGSKRSKPNTTPRSSFPGDTPDKVKFKCIFQARCCITHCRKNRKASKSSGYDTIHHMVGHFNAYHTVIRCQRCHLIFNGGTAMTSKNEHQRSCNSQALAATDEVIDCDMKAKLTQKTKRFRNWSPEKVDDGDQDMIAWVSNNIFTLTGINNPRAELGEVELKTLVYGERELAKWYTCWITLFPNLPIPQNPFYEPNISTTLQNQHRLQILLRDVAIATVEESGFPPVDFQDQLKWFQECLSLTLNLLMPRESNTAGPFASNLDRQIVNMLQQDVSSTATSIFGMQGRIPTIAQSVSTIPVPQNVSPSPFRTRMIGDVQAQGQLMEGIVFLQQHERAEEILSPTPHPRNTDRITYTAFTPRPVTLAPTVPTQTAQGATQSLAKDERGSEIQNYLLLPPDGPACTLCHDTGYIWVVGPLEEKEWQRCASNCAPTDFVFMQEDT